MDYLYLFYQDYNRQISPNKQFSGRINKLFGEVSIKDLLLAVAYLCKELFTHANLFLYDFLCSGFQPFPADRFDYL